MKSTKILFQTQELGYIPVQVDTYIQKFTEEHTRLQTAFAELNHKYCLLERRHAVSGVSAKAIPKVLVDAEVKAMQIIADAKNLASHITEKAHMELEKIQQEKEHTTAEIHEMLNRLMGILPATSSTGI